MYQLMIVEDRYELRQSLCQYIPWQEMGFKLCADFGEAAKALDFLESGQPVDVMLCDILMPVMSGMDLAREVYERKLRCKIVFLSAHKEFEYAQEAMRYGVRDYLIKPATYQDLQTVFKRIRTELDNAAQPSLHIDGLIATESADSHHERLIGEAQAYVMRNYRTASLETVADELHMSPQYFSRLYKRITGSCFSDFLNDVRMKNAERLLLDVHIRTGQVGELLGYSNANNFARAFRNYYHMSPSEFRANDHKKEDPQ